MTLADSKDIMNAMTSLTPCCAHSLALGTIQRLGVPKAVPHPTWLGPVGLWMFWGVSGRPGLRPAGALWAYSQSGIHTPGWSGKTATCDDEGSREPLGPASQHDHYPHRAPTGKGVASW